VDHSLPKFRRLRKTWEYQNVWKMGCKLHTPHFILLIMKNSASQSRLGMTVSRKVGNAVERNRVKRLIREFFRLNYQHFSESVDFSVVAKKGVASLSSRQLFAELDRAFS
jgi:ribonuclease P protein component